MDNEQLSYWGQAAANFTGMLKDSMGVFIEPAKMRRVHNAEMEIKEDNLRQACRLEEMSIRERARLRALETELRRQANLEDIGTRALSMLPETATPEYIDVNWINTFSSCAEDVGEDELKNLWANILCNESQSPGKYSKRTLNILKDFDVNDCRMCEQIAPLVFEILDETESFCGILWNEGVRKELSYRIMRHLESIGMLVFPDFGMTYVVNPGDNVVLKYGEYVNKFANNSDNDLPIDNLVSLTETGKQIISIINCSYDDRYKNMLVSVFKDNKFTEV
ncbi:DUF2806 domain-containing protein [Clostridium butyricum]|nr:DUF2806 domain-containing protein [Clostridium butyricum]MDI9208578.1 DUF2806 domain-containing protein [Clostridium butyricum]